MGAERLTVTITNHASGKSVNYGAFDVDYDAKTATPVGSLNRDGLLDITPTAASIG